MNVAESMVQRLTAPYEKQRVTAHEATLAIRELAERQHGVVAWGQLIAIGLGEGLIKHRVRAGQLLQIHRGVFALGRRRIGLHGEWLAAVLACGPNAVLSYGSAAQLWDIRGSRGPIEVTRRSGHRRPHGVRLHQTRSLPAEHVAIRAGIPVTTPERTLLDLAQRLDRRQMERALVAADRASCICWPELLRVVDEGVGRRGRGMLRCLCHRVDPEAVEARSNPEVDFLALCREARLPSPRVNVMVEGRMVDFFWPPAGLVVEIDSYQYHGDRSAFERDHESTVTLMSAGYRVLRFTEEMLEVNPDRVIRLLRDNLCV
jgi:very-short-patch-repair endonuclease/predicted transcriptional regulator of viral defense system